MLDYEIIEDDDKWYPNENDFLLKFQSLYSDIGPWIEHNGTQLIEQLSKTVFYILYNDERDAQDDTIYQEYYITDFINWGAVVAYRILTI